MTTPAINSIQPSGTAAVDDSRRANKANLEKAAQQFEAVFLNMMLKEARKASLGDGMFDSESTKTFRDMQDNRISQEMARHGTLGIAKAMVAFMERAQPLAVHGETKGEPE